MTELSKVTRDEGRQLFPASKTSDRHVTSCDTCMYPSCDITRESKIQAPAAGD